MSTKIEWVRNDGSQGTTWNPISGCSPASEGCQNCYARRMARRLAGRYGYPPRPNEFKVTLHPDKLDEPLRWKKPRMVFVCSMSDLFHADVSDASLVEIFATMDYAPQHTYLLLTKRAERMRDFITKFYPDLAGVFPHVWLGVTAENQRRADERIPLLLQTPAAVRFVSCEPLLGPVSLRPHTGSARWLGPMPPERFYDNPSHDIWTGEVRIIKKPRPVLNWIITGGESGPGARPMHPDWARSLRDQATAAGVPFFFKRWGDWVYTSDKWGIFDHRKYGAYVLRSIITEDGTLTIKARVWESERRLLDGRTWDEMPEREVAGG